MRGIGHRKTDKPSCADAVAIAAQLCDSPEARKQAGEVEANALAEGLRALAQASSRNAHASQVLSAICDYVQPDEQRTRRDAATSDAEQVYWSLKLVGMQAADRDDLVKLAHALARLDRLDEALFWVGETLKADDSSADMWRFRASLLERLGRFRGSVGECPGRESERLAGRHCGR